VRDRGSALSVIPSVSGRTPTKVVYSADIDYEDNKFSALGFNDRFVVKWTGQTVIKNPGTYTFQTCSDDGSKLYVGGQLVVNNDGLHGTQCKEASLSLPAGGANIVVNFFENGGGAVCRVYWKGPDVGNLFVKMHLSGSWVKKSDYSMEVTMDMSQCYFQEPPMVFTSIGSKAQGNSIIMFSSCSRRLVECIAQYLKGIR
jgi:hypothetical protein